MILQRSDGLRALTAVKLNGYILGENKKKMNVKEKKKKKLNLRSSFLIQNIVHSCQNVNHIVNEFLIFSYRIS